MPPSSLFPTRPTHSHGTRSEERIRPCALDQQFSLTVINLDLCTQPNEARLVRSSAAGLAEENSRLQEELVAVKSRLNWALDEMHDMATLMGEYGKGLQDDSSHRLSQLQQLGSGRH